MAERVRFAPSPTGLLHLGGLRTALFNYLYARKTGGSFILRIEDTDQSRLVPDSVNNLIENLSWAGIDYDEGPQKSNSSIGPFFQSQRRDLYMEMSKVLLQSGAAYKCYCSKERLEGLRSVTGFLRYDGRCKQYSNSSSLGDSSVIRLRVPEGQTSFNDLVYGKISVQNGQVDDVVLMKSDGFPTYHFANVVDDHFMKISTVLRGQEWLPSTPLHHIIYKSFGWAPPKYAHLPLLLRPDRNKLSKRRGDAFVNHYRDLGYSPGALLNFVALLGWAPKDNKEIMTLKEMINEFNLEQVNQADCIVDLAKLNWINRKHLQLAVDNSLSHLITEIRKHVPNDINFSDEYLGDCIQYCIKRVDLVKDIWIKFPYLFISPSSYFISLPETVPFFTHLVRVLSSDFSQIDDCLKRAIDVSLVDRRKCLAALRAAICGVESGPPVLETMELLGRKECIKRINLYLEHIGMTNST